MTKTISLRDANQRFAKIIREVEETGETYQVLRHGQPVARITPEPTVERRKFTAEEDRSWQAFLDIIDRAKPSDGKKMTTDEMHERDPEEMEAHRAYWREQSAKRDRD